MNEMKNTQGVMINVEEDVKKFVSNADNIQITPIYNGLFEEVKDKIEQMAKLEELILQQKCMGKDGTLNIKLSLLRDYVYARCPFYRRDKSTKDIRVILGRIDLLVPGNTNPSLDELYKNDEIIKLATGKLMSAMRDEFVEKSAIYFKMYD